MLCEAHRSLSPIIGPRTLGVARRASPFHFHLPLRDRAVTFKGRNIVILFPRCITLQPDATSILTSGAPVPVPVPAPTPILDTRAPLPLYLVVPRQRRTGEWRGDVRVGVRREREGEGVAAAVGVLPALLVVGDM